MTQDELAAIPERPAWWRLGVQETVRNGKTIKTPVLVSARVIWREADDPVRIVDREGHWWTIGRDHGRRYKQRLPERDC